VEAELPEGMPPTETAHVLAVQPYGYIMDPRDMGSGAVGSRARLLWATMLIGTGVIPRTHLFVVFPQKMRPRYSSVTPKSEQKSLCRMMAEYFSARPEVKREGINIQFDSLSAGTYDDILATYEMARRLVTAGRYSKINIHFVTDAVHMRRVRLIWEKTRPPDWTAEFHPAEFHRMSWKERWIREPLAYMAILFGLRGGTRK